MRAGTAMSWVRIVAVVARAWNLEARVPAARVRLNAIAARTVESVEPLACGGRGGDLAGAPGSVSSKVQVLDLEEHSPWTRRQRRSATIVMPMHQLDERELVAVYGASRATICRVLPDEDLSTAPT